jgi:hypothetical protein
MTKPQSRPNIPDRFYAITWMAWARFIILAGLGLFMFLFGLDVWLHDRTNAIGDPISHEFGRNLSLGSLAFFLLATLPLSTLVNSWGPRVRCYKEGIECVFHGRTALDQIPLIPSFFRIAFALLSGQGYRSQRFRIEWNALGSPLVSGRPAMYVFTLPGIAVSPLTGEKLLNPSYAQAELRLHPQKIQSAINAFRIEPNLRESLASWDDARIS